MGRLEWRYVSAGEIDGQTLEDLLRLEDAGWKGDFGTSLQSETRAFFLDFIGRFRCRGQAFFTEMRLDGKVIASTCNISSGITGFAFKLGWDPAYCRQSVGFLNEYLLVREAPAHLSHLRHMGSGAEPGSFLEQLWTDSRVLLTDAYCLNHLAYLYLWVYRSWLAFKRRVREARGCIFGGTGILCPLPPGR